MTVSFSTILFSVIRWHVVASGIPDPFLLPAGRSSLLRREQECDDDRRECAKLGAELFAPTGLCKYPAAELCRATCGFCRRVHLAKTCQTPAGGCAPLCARRVDWGAFFRRILDRPIAKQHGGRLLSSYPFMIEVPKFLTRYESEVLIGLANRTVVPEDEVDPEVRDVSKYDCEDPDCLFHPLVGEIYRRVSELLGVGMENFESLEFLRYRKGQHYVTHPDAMSERDLLEEGGERGAGQRVLTVFFYFSDVEEGGETLFPHAKPTPLRVKPEIGKLVIWSNVKEDPWKTSRYAEHQATPVKKGMKWAANFWVHPQDVRAPGKFSGHC